MAVRRKPFGTHTLDKSEEPTQGRLEVRGEMAGTGPGGPLVNPPPPPPYAPDGPEPPREGGNSESPREMAPGGATPRRPMEPTPMASVPGAAAFTPMPPSGGVEDLVGLGSPAGGASLVPGAVRRRSALAGNSGGLLGGGLGLPGGDMGGGQDISPLIQALLKRGGR